jgi:hypothetical protein
MQRSNTETKWVQMEDASASQENITSRPHGFLVSELREGMQRSVSQQNRIDNGCPEWRMNPQHELTHSF